METITTSEPSTIDEQLQKSNLSLFGGRNDCVWATIAYLTRTSVQEIKLRSGLSPTQGINGIHANAVKGLLTSLGVTFGFVAC